MSILTAKIGVATEHLNLVNTATQVVQQTENAYWDVVFAMYAYHVAVDSKHEADDTFALTRRQIDAGTLATSELPGAEATVAARQVAVLRAATQVETAWDALRGVLDLPRRVGAAVCRSTCRRATRRNRRRSTTRWRWRSPTVPTSRKSSSTSSRRSWRSAGPRTTG